MALEKKSFLFYTDWIDTFKKLPKDKGYDLLMHMLSYVNDENPETDDILVDAVFQQIKNTLKRDLNNWKSTKGERSENGKMGNLKRWNLDLYTKVVDGEMDIIEAEKIAKRRKLSGGDSQPSPTIANVAVNDNVNVNVNVKKNDIDARKLKFADTLKPFIEKYGREMLNEFYKYWTESNKSNTKFKQELQKTWEVARRLDTWSKNEKFIKPKEDLKSNFKIS